MRGLQWSKSGEFKEFKTGSGALDAKPIDPSSIGFSSTQARLPKVSEAVRSDIEDAVDEPLYDAMNSFTDDIEGNLADAETETNAIKVAVAAWPGIVARIKPIVKDMPAEQSNKVWQWAKNRSKQVWGVTQDIPGHRRSGGRPGDAHTDGMMTTVPGVYDRVLWKRAGVDRNAPRQTAVDREYERLMKEGFLERLQKQPETAPTPPGIMRNLNTQRTKNVLVDTKRKPIRVPR